MKMTFNVKPYVHALAFMCAASAFAQAQAATVLSYTSSAQSWVGHGETISVTPEDGFAFTVSRNYDNGVSFAINDFASNPDFQAAQWWYLDFAAAYNATLSAGTYDNATRFPFQSAANPGLTFSGNGRGDNTLTGSFKVLEVTYGANGTVLTFAADFIQYDEGLQDWWNVGAIRYNSDIPVASVPEPSAILLFGIAAAAVLPIVRRRQAA